MSGIEPNRSSRRTFLVGILGFAGGITSGVAATYLGDYLGAVAPPGEAADRSSIEGPVRALAFTERKYENQGNLWVFPFLISTRPEVHRLITSGRLSLKDRNDAFYKAGAVDVNITNVKMILEGRRNVDVRVTGMRAKVLKSGEPLAAACSILTPGPQGQDDNVQVGFNLDDANLEARDIDPEANQFGEDGFFLANRFDKGSLAMARNGQEVVQITARTLRGYVEWVIEIDVLTDGAIGTLTVDLNGTPFKTSASIYDRDDGFGDPTVPSEDSYGEVYEESQFMDSDYDYQPGVASTFERIK